jgi:hypothetical protein
VTVRELRIPRTPAESAGVAAFRRAKAMGYCDVTARQLQRAAQSDCRPGETAHDTAERVVAHPFASATEAAR